VLKKTHIKERESVVDSTETHLATYIRIYYNTLYTTEPACFCLGEKIPKRRLLSTYAYKTKTKMKNISLYLFLIYNFNNYLKHYAIEI